MLQEINLYQVKKVSKSNFLTLKQIGYIALGFSVFLFLISLGSIYNQYRLNAQVKKLAQTHNILNKNLELQKKKIPTDEERANLIAEVKRLEDLRTSRQTMYAALGKVQYTVQPGFSGYFQGLSKYTVAGIWFTDIRISSGGDVINLEGNSIAAENVPKLLQSLDQDAIFDGKKFEALDLYIKEKGDSLIHFTLKTNL